MRFMASLAALLLISACATAAPSAPSAPSAPTARPADSTRAAQLLSAAGRANAPARNDIERELGAPDIARQEGAGMALTYRLRSCALLLVFTADARNVMRLSQTHVSPRREGETTPTLDQCASEAAARR
jgi:hypothetical protein